MTYPQQGYQPQQPPYGQPPMQTYAQPAYQPQAPAPVATYAPPQFSDPSTGGEGGAPLKIREIEGRACGIRPVKFVPATPGAMFMGAPQSDSIVIDVLVLDGAVPLQYGESRANDGTGGPAVYALDALPAEVKGVISNNSEVVKACKAILDSAPGNVIPCRVVRGTQGNRPFLLAALGSPLDTAPADADRVRGMLGAAYVAIGTGRWPDGSPYVAPVPREINGGPRQKPNQANAQATPAVQPTYPPQAAYPPAAPAGQVVYPQATAQHPIAQAYNAQAPTGQQYAPQPTAPPAAPVQQQFAPGSREAYLSGQEAPAGWDLATWQTKVAPADRAQFLPQQ